MDIAQLGIAVTTTDLATGEARLRSFGTAAEQTERKVDAAAKGIGQDFKAVSTEAKVMGAGLQSAGNNVRSFGAGAVLASQQTRMMSLQLSQVAQQTMSSGDFLRALAIQLPDMAVGFGTVGIAAGVLAGIGLPLLASAFGAGSDKAQTLTERLDSLADAVTAYQEAVDLAQSSAAELTDKFGPQSEAIQKTLDLLQNIALSKAMDSLNVSMGQLDTARLRTLVDIVSYGAGEIGAFSDNYNRALAELQEDFRLTSDEAVSLLAAIEEMGSAQGPRHIAYAARDLNALLLDIYGTVQAIPPEFRDMAEAAARADVSASSMIGTMDTVASSAVTFSDVMDAVTDSINSGVDALYAMRGAAPGGGWLAAAIADAGTLAGRLWDAANAAAAARGADLAALGPDERGSQREQVTSAGNQRAQRTLELARRNSSAYLNPKSGGGGGGGGGGVDDRVREAERIFKDTRTAAEEYGAELEDLEELHELGYLDADTFARAVAKLDEELNKASFEAFQKGIEQIADTFADAIVNGENLGDAFGNLLKRMASDLLSSELQGLMRQLLFPSAPKSGGFFGSLLGGLFGGKAPSFEGGGFTGNGSRTGGIDGRGGIPAILHPNETVIDHTKGQSSGGVTNHFTINVSGARGNAEITEMVDAGIRQAAPSIAGAAVSTVQRKMSQSKSFGTGG